MRRKLSDSARLEYTRIAHYYYKAGLTQSEIADKMGISRQKINRVLGECLDLGIVEIRIHGQEHNHLDLETQLETMYGLHAVRIATEQEGEDLFTALGHKTGEYLSGVVQNGDIIGFGRGKTLSAVAHTMPKITRENLCVTQLVGGQNEHGKMSPIDDIVFRCARRMGATPSLLHAPILLQNPDARHSLFAEPYFKEAYDTIRRCTIAVFGIGDVASHRTLFPWQSEDAGWIKVKGTATGEVCTHFYDQMGVRIPSSLDARTIAISEPDLKAVPLRIGIGGGQNKLPAIQGAIHGGYLNVLITDLTVAEQLLSANRQQAPLVYTR